MNVDDRAAERPDVVLMDIRMPNMGGLEAARHVLGEMPHCRVIKDVTAEHLAAAVRLVDTGDAGKAESRRGEGMILGGDRAESVRSGRRGSPSR
ncbi:response regulator [Nonomuraea sp. NPDC046570]|uniref:response regulator n=1 Tax=Nonomuraea sp. NPDC046570 TaxID=3155255 RepID=UPI0033D014CE